MKKLLAYTTALVVFGASLVAEKTTYEIDPAHSYVGFKIGHLMTHVPGAFENFEGSIVFDAETPENSETSVIIQAASIATRVEKRDDHLRSADFFDVEQFPVLTFKSTEWVKTDEEDSYEITGKLTIMDKTLPVTLDAKYLGEAKDPWGNTRMGWKASTTIKRSDWGITHSAPLVGDEVLIKLQVQGIKK